MSVNKVSYLVKHEDVPGFDTWHLTHDGNGRTGSLQMSNGVLEFELDGNYRLLIRRNGVLVGELKDGLAFEVTMFMLLQQKLKSCFGETHVIEGTAEKLI